MAMGGVTPFGRMMEAYPSMHHRYT